MADLDPMVPYICRLTLLWVFDELEAVGGPRDRRKAMLQDIATLTGGPAISEDLGIKLDQVKLDMLGKAKKATIEEENTTIVNGAGKKADIQGRISQIKAEIPAPHKEGVAKAEDGADVVVGSRRQAHHRNRPTWLSKKLVTGRFRAAQLRRCQRPAHIRAIRWRLDGSFLRSLVGVGTVLRIKNELAA